MKNVARLLIIVGAVVALAGCDFLAWFIPEPEFVDVGVTSVVVDDSGTTGVETVTITFANSGMSVENVVYAVVISNGESLSYFSDLVIYESEVDLPFNESTTVIVTRDQIDDYLTATAETYSPGSYYIGVIMDPQDRLDDSTGSDNQGVSNGEYNFL
jgi:hypothetical protein